MNQKAAVLKLTGIQLAASAVIETARWFLCLLAGGISKEENLLAEELMKIHFYYGSSTLSTIISLAMFLVYIIITFFVARHFCKDKLIDARPSTPFIIMSSLGALLIINNLMFFLGTTFNIFAFLAK